MDSYQEEEPVASTSGLQDLQTLSELVGPENAGEGDLVIAEEPEENPRRPRRYTKRDVKCVSYHAYKELEDKHPHHIKLQDWIPKPEEMSKSICKRLILCGLYSGEKAREILKKPFTVSWEQSETNPDCFIVSYTCIFCDAVIHDPMPVVWDSEVEIWVKYKPLRGIVGSAVFIMEKHQKNCSLVKPSTSCPEGPKPRRRHDPVLRCDMFEKHHKPRPKRSRKRSIDHESCASSGDTVANESGPLCTNTFWTPGPVLQGLLGESSNLPDLEVHMSGGPFWKEVYGDSILGPPSGSGEHSVL
ncbi:taf protein [Western chimpanzee simian foamy virus]|uniref:Protein Bel-1 n=1 Tax=Simian foamy virus (isolate chimpanzee) TaxID=298339 RepID=BEL1_SFVCP|nr:taf protein [Western chimpanzee simian foamy virus]Q87042.1 RecName: Full=Protein Bel-1; AltName: Full=Transactivator of spumavirus; Short=Tas; AltName: Full=Transcriptional transactivator [Pan troglodytes foamy virus]AAA19980.1 taf [Western chimpanzee simian foamy virus]